MTADPDPDPDPEAELDHLGGTDRLKCTDCGRVRGPMIDARERDFIPRHCFPCGEHTTHRVIDCSDQDQDQDQD